MSSVLSQADEATIKEMRAPLRKTINAIANQHTRQLLLAMFGFRNSTLGRRPAVSVPITPRTRRVIKAAPATTTDRELAQQFNVAIHHVSRIRRGTRK